MPSRSFAPVLRSIAVSAFFVVLASWWSPAARAAPDKTTKSSKSTVAILYFDYSGKTEDMEFLRKGLTQMLVSDLADTPGVTIVERTRLEEVLAELDLARDKKIDQKNAVAVGKLLSARYLVLGGYFDFQGSLQVSVKVVDVETGTVVAGVSQRGNAEGFFALEQRLAADIREVLSTQVVAFTEAHAEKQTRTAREKRKKSGPRKPRAASKTATAESAPDRPAPRVPAVGGSAAKAPALDASTAARYGRALDAMDRGDKGAARADLEAVVQASPDFKLAAVDLAGLAK